MSTTFDVFPRRAHIPSFQEVIARAEGRLRFFFDEFGIAASTNITAALHAVGPDDTDVVVPLELNGPAKWGEGQYVFFQVAPSDGGTDAYFSTMEGWQLKYWLRLLREDEAHRSRGLSLRSCLHNGYYWTFRRSAGQSPLVNIAYGMLATSLAELTDGFLCSEDGAWDWQRFPATAAEFDTWYFRPDRTLDPGNREWAEQCIQVLREETP